MLVVVVIFVLLIVVAMTLIMPNNFQEGDIDFEQPDGWNKELVFGTFDENSVISEIIYKKDGENKNKNSYITFRLMKKDQSKINSTTEIVILSNTNYSMKTKDFNKNKVKEYSKTYNGTTQYIALIENAKYDIILESVCPTEYEKETEHAYTKILNTLKIN